jgi:hypothetical protein
MKNRKRESCTSGTVRDEDGNILIYSARPPLCAAPPSWGRHPKTFTIPDVVFSRTKIRPLIRRADEELTCISYRHSNEGRSISNSSA